MTAMNLSVVGSGPILMPGKSCSRNNTISVRVHDSDEPVCGWLRSYSDAREVLFQKVPDEGGLACAVLPHQHHHWLCIKVRVVQGRGVEIMELVFLLKR